jgi:integrase
MRRIIQRGIRLKGLKTSGRWPSGNVRYYYRNAKPAIPMPDAPPDSPTFLAAYAAAAAGAPTKVGGKVQHRTGTIGAGIRAFLASDDFLRRAASTRSRWKNFAEEFEDFFGKAKLDDLRAPHIRKYLAKFGPHPANNRLRVWRAMGKWWVDAGLIEEDPARAVRSRAAPKSDGFIPWTMEDAEAFRDHWAIGTQQRFTFELLFLTGTAIGDAVVLGPKNIKDGWLTCKRAKTGTTSIVPLFIDNPPHYYPSNKDLLACIDASPRHLTYLSTAKGGSRSPKAAGQWFAQAARTAGIQKTAHGVRKLLASYMAEHGATDGQRMAILGHDTTSQAQDYAKSADARRIISGTNFDNSHQQVVKLASK